MAETSIAAYDLPERVARYDADMEVMHPNRSAMVEAALELLPFAPEEPLRALDLGVGTGFFAERFLRRFPRAALVAVDGAAAMVALARARLGPLAERVRFAVGDFRELERLVPAEGPLDVAFTSFALHHLTRADKAALVRAVRERLRPGGWFLNDDLCVAEDPALERRIQELRVAGIVRRSAGADPRFRDAATTRAFLDRMEAEEGDRPLSLRDDLDVLRSAGLRAPGVVWLDHREAVCAALR